MFDPVMVNCVMGILYYIYHCHCWLSSETFAYHSFINGFISFVQILYFGSILSGFEWAGKFEGIRMGRIALDVLQLFYYVYVLVDFRRFEVTMYKQMYVECINCPQTLQDYVRSNVTPILIVLWTRTGICRVTFYFILRLALYLLSC